MGSSSCHENATPDTETNSFPPSSSLTNSFPPSSSEFGDQQHEGTEGVKKIDHHVDHETAVPGLLLAGRIVRPCSSSTKGLGRVKR